MKRGTGTCYGKLRDILASSARRFEIPARHVCNPAMKVCRRIWLAIAPALLLSLSGCLSTTLYETARVCPPGTVEATVAATPWYWRRDSTRFVLETWNKPIPELSARIGLFKNFDAGVRLLPAPGACLTGKYQLLAGPVDIAVNAAGYGYGLSAVTVAASAYGGYAGVLVSRERGISFSAQGTIAYDQNFSIGDFASTRTQIVTARFGLGLPFIDGPIRVHPAATCSVPLFWERLSSYSRNGRPPRQQDDWRGVVTLDLGVGISFRTGHGGFSKDTIDGH